MNKAPLKSIVALLLLLIGVAIVVSGFLPPRATSEFDLIGFGKLPVQYGTRVLPIDSVARNTLKLFSTHEALYIPDLNSKEPDAKILLPANQWFLDLAFRPESAERVPVFRIDNDEVLGLIGQLQKGSQYFSFLDLAPHFDDIQKAADAADTKKQNEEPLSSFENEISRLRENLQLFQQMAMSFVPPGGTPVEDWDAWQSSLKSGAQAVLDKDAGKNVEQNLLDSFTLQVKRFMDLNNNAIVGLVPPANVESKWSNLGQGALEALHSGQLNPILHQYGELGEALRKGDPQSFNITVAGLQKELDMPSVTTKAHLEVFLNNLAPFYRGAEVCVLAFICAMVSWISWGPELRRTGLWLTYLVFALLTLGLVARVYLTGYSVVTSLYTSALFIGWASVVLGIAIELVAKRSIGVALASSVGFAALVIAHNLPFSGDDLERPRAVLATNLWLSTHVTCVTLGYTAMFVAGALATGYVLMNLFSVQPNKDVSKLLLQLVYGVTCFAMLFSFVGTMLGGIWADQSWGRFWGWDPKENGALLIVLWAAICLHARWGKLCGPRGMMALAIFGNVVTAWSWFGVNMLGIGLHSYGFMDKILWALCSYWLLQLVLIVLAFLPAQFWKTQSAATAQA